MFYKHGLNAEHSPDSEAFPIPPLPEEAAQYDVLFKAPVAFVEGAGSDWLGCTVNLLCRAWLQQQRVVVTSSSGELLKAVHDRLEPALKLLSAVSGPEALAQSRRLNREWQILRQLQVECEEKLIAQIEREAQVCAVQGKSFTPLLIGRFVEQHQARDSWLGDGLANGEKLPLSVAELEALRSTWAAGEPPAEDRAEVGALEQLRKLPDVALVKKLIADSQQEGKSDAPPTRGPGALLVAEGCNADQAATVLAPLRTAAASLKKLPKLEGWIQKFVSETLAGQDAWKRRKGHLDRVVPHIQPVINELQGRVIEQHTKLPDKELREKLVDILRHLESGKAATWLRSLVDWKVAGWRKVLQHVRLDSKPCYGLPELRLVMKWLELKQALALVWQDWQGIAAPKSDALPDQAEKLANLQSTLGKILSVLEPRQIAADAVRGLKVKNLALPSTANPAEVEAFAASIEAYVSFVRRPKRKHPFATPLQTLGQLAAQFPQSRLVKQVMAALDSCQVADYERTLQQIAAAVQRAAHRRRAASLGARLAAAMPAFAHQLHATASEDIWKTRLPEIEAARDWSLAYRWLRDFSAQQNTRVLHRRQAELAQAVSQAALLRAAALGLAADHPQQEPADWQTLVGGCGWSAPASALLTNDSVPELDVILLLSDGQSLPDEAAMRTRARQLIILERSDSSAAAHPAGAFRWREFVAQQGGALQTVSPLDPRALPTTARLDDGESLHEQARLERDVAGALVARGFRVREPLPDSATAWRPTLVIPDPTLPLAVQCYGDLHQSPEAIRLGLRGQNRWQLAGWQVKQLYASDFLALGPQALDALAARPIIDAAGQQSYAASGKKKGKRTKEQTDVPIDSPATDPRWRRLLALGAKLQFNEAQQLLSADFRHTLAGLADLAELADCHALQTVHFPAHATDQMLRQCHWLPRLTGLNLSYTQISNRGLKQLEPNVQLRRLGLCGTPITDDGVRSLMQLSDLTDLDLRMTPISRAGGQAIRGIL